MNIRTPFRILLLVSLLVLATPILHAQKTIRVRNMTLHLPKLDSVNGWRVTSESVNRSYGHVIYSVGSDTSKGAAGMVIIAWEPIADSIPPNDLDAFSISKLIGRYITVTSSGVHRVNFERAIPAGEYGCAMTNGLIRRGTFRAGPRDDVYWAVQFMIGDIGIDIMASIDRAHLEMLGEDVVSFVKKLRLE